MTVSEERREAIYLACYPKVRGYLAARVRDPFEAEDLAQEVFVKVYQKLDGFDEEKASVSTWVYAITKNTLIDHYRTKHQHSELPETLASEENLEAALCRADTLETLARALQALDERRRDIVILRYYKGLSLKEIALRMGLSYSYTKALHSGALETLKRALA